MSRTAISGKNQTGTGSPEGSVKSRRAGDQYTDTASGLTYTNPTSGATTGRELIQTTAA